MPIELQFSLIDLTENVRKRGAAISEEALDIAKEWAERGVKYCADVVCYTPLSVDSPYKLNMSTKDHLEPNACSVCPNFLTCQTSRCIRVLCNRVISVPPSPMSMANTSVTPTLFESTFADVYAGHTFQPHDDDFGTAAYGHPHNDQWLCVLPRKREAIGDVYKRVDWFRAPGGVRCPTRRSAIMVCPTCAEQKAREAVYAGCAEEVYMDGLRVGLCTKLESILRLLPKLEDKNTYPFMLHTKTGELAWPWEIKNFRFERGKGFL